MIPYIDWYGPSANTDVLDVSRRGLEEGLRSKTFVSEHVVMVMVGVGTHYYSKSNGLFRYVQYNKIIGRKVSRSKN